MQNNRLTLRLRRADHAVGGVSAADIGRMLVAVDAAVQACAADSAAPRQSPVRSLSLSSADGQDPVLQLDFNASDDILLSRFVAAASAAFAGEPCEADLELHDLQRAIPHGIDAIQMTHGASSTFIPREQPVETSPLDDRWVADLVDRMTYGKVQPFTPLTAGERLDFDVEEFNRLVAEGRRAAE